MGGINIQHRQIHHHLAKFHQTQDHDRKGIAIIIMATKTSWTVRVICVSHMADHLPHSPSNPISPLSLFIFADWVLPMPNQYLLSLQVDYTTLQGSGSDPGNLDIISADISHSRCQSILLRMLLMRR